MATAKDIVDLAASFVGVKEIPRIPIMSYSIRTTMAGMYTAERIHGAALLAGISSVWPEPASYSMMGKRRPIVRR